VSQAALRPNLHADFCWRFQLKTSLSQPNSSQPAVDINNIWS
jgi:hypothetical protein